MGRKAAKNRYGVQVGDIFTQAYSYEDFDGYYFYQVIALRGETQVVVRRIMESMVAFDGHCEQVVPVPDAWVSDEALIRRVFDGFGSMNRINICIEKGWNGFAYLDNLDSEKIHLKRRRNAPFRIGLVKVILKLQNSLTWRKAQVFMLLTDPLQGWKMDAGL